MHTARFLTISHSNQWGLGPNHLPPPPWTEGMTHACETLPQTSHTKLAIMALIPTLYSHIFYSFLHYLNLKTLETVKLDDIWQKGITFQCRSHNQNEVGNIGIPVLWRDHEKLWSFF